MSALFPDHADVLIISTQPEDRLGYELAGRVRLRECQRCAAWVAVSSVGRHEAYHRSVDTDQTTDLANYRSPFLDRTKYDGETMGERYSGTTTAGAYHSLTDTHGSRHDGRQGSSEPDAPNQADGPGTASESG